MATTIYGIDIDNIILSTGNNSTHLIKKLALASVSQLVGESSCKVAA